MRRRASCCCGRCSVEVEGEPALNAVCHCRNCKQRTGSAFGWSLYFPDAQVVGKTGELKVYTIEATRPQQRWFCGNCGSTLFWRTALMPEHTGVAGGCFAETQIGVPSLTASDEGRCAWVSLPESWRVLP